MKKTLYIITCLLSLFLLNSCEFKEGDIFDKPSAERMSEALIKYDEILNAAPNGWVMEYFAGENPKVDGGHCFIVSFNKGRCTMVTDKTVTTKELEGNEQITVTYKAGDEASSLYSMKSDEGPILSFDSNNPLLHYFMQPTGSNNAGLAGDYEFIIMKADSEELVLKGKKWNKKVILTPLKAEKNWKEYIEEAIAVKEAVKSNYRYELYLNNQMKSMVTLEDKIFFYDEDHGELQENITFLNNGMKFLNPILLEGNILEDIDWDHEKNVFTKQATTGEMVLKPVNLAYEDYLGAYSFTYSTNDEPQTMVLTEKVPGKSYTVTDEALGFEFELLYKEGNLSLTPQKVGSYGVNNEIKVEIRTAADLFGIIFYTNIAASKMKTKWARGTQANPQLIFVSDGSFLTAPISHFVLYETKPAPTPEKPNNTVQGLYMGGANTFIDLVMTKK